MNTLVIFVVTAVSLSFYFEFSKVLDQRILLHLNSIKTLKKIQLERLIDKEWNTFNYIDNKDRTSQIKLPKNTFLTPGIYDLTHLHPTKKTSIGLIKVKDSVRYLKIISYQKIKQILLERTGMGASGESYLVGADYRLRSQSRFSPKKTPYKIEAKTKNVINAFEKGNGDGIFLDYRNTKVYSVYNPLKLGNLNWVILSEIDVAEVNIPLQKMRLKLAILTLIIITISIILSLFLTKIITEPIKKIQNSILLMVKGDYKNNLSLKKSPTEIIEIANALNNLKAMLSGAVAFSMDIGEMNLTSEYQPKSNSDLLGHSLLKMREKLTSYRNIEKEINLSTKRYLVEGLENERARLARELHDGIGPLLITLKLYIQNNIYDKTHKETMKNMIDTTITEVRQMTNVLMPTSLDNFGIGVTLINYVDTIRNSIKASIFFEDFTKKGKSNINKNQEINLFRITQELINNSIKHAQATEIRITLTEFNDFLSLYYFDNGIGFDIKKVTMGAGISNIKERVEISEGTFLIESTTNSTVFEIEMPIKNTKHD
ncbi:sensor histidine kinase [Polaribacter sp. L3A8]|uniref:sensor histidine kinase n=1 Tax=Polaribacter sp. L3A8 TaxID=2686361 RepID=UPI001E492E2D|nr:sensor histidine kinase [Polaribacter sp. L3A8]